MALIKKLEERSFERPNLHSEVVCTYAIFEKDGQKLLQIDTYGRADREFPGKVSQSIQFDAESAAQLLDILHKEFGE
ncbi:methionyl-tRNA formyltransferase [Poseidonocella sedimentorum]|uniref:methionyl-tRNA formyltransferase n=1 Tax=Poseidonocella sedimentorum TaxID=871652 RepID=UPI000B85A429|nr:methionyl-tRNA formyltransferase [Poseidonocella sedimentorum]